MNSHGRRYLLALYGHRYAVSEPFGSDNCAYCGDPAQCQDHVPPLSACEAIELAGLRVDYRLVPSCRSCNALLGRSQQRTLTKRRRFILKALTRKQFRILRRVVWDDDEIAELGRCLQSYVESAEMKRRNILDRLRTLKAYS